jgi:hypothetical protein
MVDLFGLKFGLAHVIRTCIRICVCQYSRVRRFVYCVLVTASVSVICAFMCSPPCSKATAFALPAAFPELTAGGRGGGRSMEDGGGAAEPLQEARAALPAKRRFGAVGPPAS